MTKNESKSATKQSRARKAGMHSAGTKETRVQKAGELKGSQRRQSAPLKPIDLDDPELLLSRELTWLAFNERVLSEAQNLSNPLLERLKFLTIFHSNLDEFFMVRLSGLLKLVEKEGLHGSKVSALDDEEIEETLDEVAIVVRRLVKESSDLLGTHLLPELSENQMQLLSIPDLSKGERDRLDEYFDQQVFPVLTPLAVDPAHPFPYLSNLSLYLAVNFVETGEDGEPLLAFVEIPSSLNRLVPTFARNKKYRFVLLEELICLHLHKLFPWTSVRGAHVFRVTRNLDYQLLEGEVKDLMKSIEHELKDRAQKIVIRLEVEQAMSAELKHRLRMSLGLDPSDVYEVNRILNPRDFSAFLKLETIGALRDEPFNPRLNARIADCEDIFEAIREQDIMFHHPYDSFVGVLEFIRQAAEDKNVLAIKQTLYRTGGDSPIIDSLVKAAENGKQVTAVVELKARFDEQNNIVWARRLERAGAHVVFGFVGLKTHAKCTLVIRKEGNSLRRYVHLSTGNYNSSTAKLYTDIGHLSADPELADDVGKLFNLLTGFNILGTEEQGRSLKRMPDFEKISAAPFDLRGTLHALIEIERKLHSSENPGHIIFKMNALTDPSIVALLYRASQSGVKIDLIVRGMCVLRPGLPGISENIRVVSIIDRFLEHSRMYWFKNGGKTKLFLSSADIMTRNLDRRIEIMWPVLDQNLKSKLTELLMEFQRDNVKSHVMQPDGSYIKLAVGEAPLLRCQERFILVARAEGVKGLAYDLAIHMTEQGAAVDTKAAKDIKPTKDRKLARDMKAAKGAESGRIDTVPMSRGKK